MSELLDLINLPYNAKYNKKNPENERLGKHNNAIMKNKFDRALAASKNPNIKALTREEREGFALFLTAMTIHESVHHTKPSGKDNWGGRTASPGQMKAGKGSEKKAWELEGEVVVTYNKLGFLDFESSDDFATSQVEYMDRLYPNFYKAKTFKEAIYSLDGKNGVYATDLLQRGNKNDVFEKNIFHNQYATKIGNYMGHGDGFLLQLHRPDMDIIGEGQDAIWQISEAGRKGTMIQRDGIYGGKKYFDQKRYNVVKEIKLDEINYIKNKQKENSNNNLSLNYIEDYTNADFVSHNLSKEDIRNSFAGNDYTADIEARLTELFPDNYEVGIGLGISNKKEGDLIQGKIKLEVDLP